MAYVKSFKEFGSRNKRAYNNYVQNAKREEKRFKALGKNLTYKQFKSIAGSGFNTIPGLSAQRYRNLKGHDKVNVPKRAYEAYRAAQAGHNPDAWRSLQNTKKKQEDIAKAARAARAKKAAQIQKEKVARIAREKAAKSASEAAKRNAAENERKRLAEEETKKKANMAKEAERQRLEMEKAAADKAAAEEAKRLAEAEEAKAKARQYVPLETGYEMEKKFTPEIEKAPPGQEDSLRYDPEVQDILARKKKYAEEGLSTREEEGIRSSGVQKMDREMQIAGLKGGAALRGREGASAAAQQRILQSAGLAGKAGIEQNIQERDEAQQRASLKEYMSTLGEVKAFDVSESESEKSREMQKKMLKEKLASADRVAASAKSSDPGGGGLLGGAVGGIIGGATKAVGGVAKGIGKVFGF